MSDSKKTFVRGSAKIIKFDGGGYCINASLNIEDLKAYADERGYVPIKICKMRKPDKYGNEHYIAIDDYSLAMRRKRAERQREEASAPRGSGSSRLSKPSPFDANGTTDDLPF